MNCKPGDLAMYIGVHVAARGMVCQVVRPVRWYDRLRCREINTLIQPVWRIDPPLIRGDGGTGEFVSDCALRPIRDNPGADETLTWAGKPQPVEA